MPLTISSRAEKPILVLIMAAVVFGYFGCSRKTSEPAAAEKPVVPLLPEDKVRLSNDPGKTEIFRDAGLGLFIHWGPNSQMGTEISWPLNNASDDYIKKYYALAETFNPVRFDPAEWARLAKLAGMEYVVFTAKHHDGFCMFDTALQRFQDHQDALRQGHRRPGRRGLPQGRHPGRLLLFAGRFPLPVRDGPALRATSTSRISTAGACSAR